MLIIAREPVLLIAALAALGALYVLLPVGLAAYRRVRGPRAVTCPETGRPEVIEVDTTRAVTASLVGHDDVEITDCSRWPEDADCDRQCAKQVLTRPA